MCVRTLDLGFEKDLTVILNSVNSAASSRQNVLLSATLTHGKLHTHTHTRAHARADPRSAVGAALCALGVTRLADVCLKDWVGVAVSGPALSEPSSCSALTPEQTSSSQAESFAVPEALKQFVVVVPSKVRLVCLAAFILGKCKVKAHFLL